MTQIRTIWANASNEGINTSNGIAMIPVTVTANAFVSVLDTADEYSDDAVARILNARNATAVTAPRDPDAFMSWLTE
jgi:hypothetical protein